MNRNYKIGITTASIAVILISIPVYLFWMYSPEAVYRRGLSSAFWLSLDNDTRDTSVSRGETKVVPVELHHWKELDTALYVELRSDGRDIDEYPAGLSVSCDLDSSVISLSKGAVMVQSKNEAARFNPPMIKQVSSDGDMVVREFGNLTVSASRDVPIGSYDFELSSGDTKIDGGGGNSQRLTVTVVDANGGQQHEQKSLTGNLTVYILPVNPNIQSPAFIDVVRDIIGNIYAAFYTDLGASPQGQYGDETVEITWDNDPDGFKKGDTITKTVIKEPAETVKFYIDPAIVNPVDGSPITTADLREDYFFGNGISCSGFSLADGTDVGNAVIIVVDWAYDSYMAEKMDELKKALGSDERITVTVDVVAEPKESLVESGMGSSLMTKYLPVNITQTIRLAEPTNNMTIYPIFADWDGIVRGQMRTFVLDENKESISFTGFATAVLHGVNATCTDPYFVKVKDTDAGEDGIKFENSTTPVSSAIYWGDTMNGEFGELQSGTIDYVEAGYGIVPADYNNNNDDTYRNNGAGNLEVSGAYHLSFTSFYPASISLPDQAEVISSFEAKCSINEDSPHVEKSEFPYIYVYDVRFKIEQ